MIPSGLNLSRSLCGLVLGGLAVIGAMTPAAQTHAQVPSYPGYRWEIFAGQRGGAGDADGPAAEARFAGPSGVSLDGAGNIFVADRFNSTIRRITPDGTVETYAGKTGENSWANGPRQQARFQNPRRIEARPNGEIYILDVANVRKIDVNGNVTAVSPFIPSHNFSGMAVDAAGNIFVTSEGQHTVMKFASNGGVMTIAGSAQNPGFSDGGGGAARFNSPQDLALDTNGDLYVVDGGNRCIRRVSTDGEVVTIAGSPAVTYRKDGTGNQAGFERPLGISFGTDGCLYVTEPEFIRKVTREGVVTTIAGRSADFTPRNGPASQASFYFPQDVVMDGEGNLIIAGGSDYTVRKLTTGGDVVTIAGMLKEFGAQDGPGAQARFSDVRGTVTDAHGNVFVLDSKNHAIRKISPAGVVTTFAGKLGDMGTADGIGTEARFIFPEALAIDRLGNLYVAERIRVRKVTPEGRVTTLAGAARESGIIDGTGPAARFRYLAGIAVDSRGNVYVSEYVNHVIRKITPVGVVTTYAGSLDTYGWTDGLLEQARFGDPLGLAVDQQDNLYVSEWRNGGLRQITPSGIVKTLTHSNGFVVGGDVSYFGTPYCIAPIADGSLILSSWGSEIFRVDPSGRIFHEAGGINGNLGGIGKSARLSLAPGVAVGPDGTAYLGGGYNDNVMKGTPIPCLVVEDPGNPDFSADHTLNWYLQPLSGPGQPRTLKLKNMGKAVLTGLDLAISGPDAAEFEISTPLNRTTLAPGEETTVSVTYRPLTAEVHTAWLAIGSSDPVNSSWSVDLAGAGKLGGAPIIAGVPADIVAEAQSTAGANVSYQTAHISDDGQSGFIIYSRYSGEVFPIGTTTVVVTAIGYNGIQSRSEFKVTVRDSTPPEFGETLEPQILKGVRPSKKAVLPDYRGYFTVIDEVAASNLPEVQNPPPGTALGPGIHTVTLTALDAAGNEASFDLMVEVVAELGLAELVVNGRTGNLIPQTPGLPLDSTLAGFGVPAIDGLGGIAAKAVIRAGRTTLQSIYRKGSAESIVAYQGQTIPAGGETFKSFGDPLLSADGSLAFAAKLQGAGVTATNDDSWWSDALTGNLEVVLREGSEILPGFKIKAVSSISLRNGELLALVTFFPSAGTVTTANDTAVLHLKAAGGEVLLREGEAMTVGTPAKTSKVKTISILGPALGSPGHGRWHAEDAAVAKVTLADGRVTIVKLQPGQDPQPLLVTKAVAEELSSTAKWSQFSLPAIDGIGGNLVVQGTLQALRGVVAATNDTVLLYSADGSNFAPLVKENDPATPRAGMFASFVDPVSNQRGDVAFVATLRGAPSGSPITGLWTGSAGNLLPVAELNGKIRDADGELVPDRIWTSFVSYALPDASGPIFVAKFSGAGVTGANDVGLWSTGLDGIPRRLLCFGDDVEFTENSATLQRRVKSFQVLNSPDGVYGATRNFNAAGAVAVHATFTDGSQAVLVLYPRPNRPN